MARAQPERRAGGITAKPQPTVKQWAFAAMSCPALLLAFWILPEDLPGKWAFVCLVWFLIVLCFFVIPVHEAGHVAAGLLVGFRFNFVNLGPVRIAREGRRIRVRVQQSSSAPMGMAGCAPVDDKRLRARLALFIAGGPIASLCASVISVSLFAQSGDRWDLWSAAAARQIWLSAPLLAAAVLFFLEFTSELAAGCIPRKPRGCACDAEWLRELLRGGPVTARCCALASLDAIVMRGVRPRDWPTGLIQAATGGPADGSWFDIIGTMYGYYPALDSGDVDRAEQVLYWALESGYRHAGASPFLPCLEAAYFCAFQRGKKAAAWEYLQRLANCRGPSPSISPHAGRRAVAAVLLAAGNMDSARQTAQEALQTIAESGDSGMDLAEADWLREIIARCDAPAPPAPDTQS